MIVSGNGDGKRFSAARRNGVCGRFYDLGFPECVEEFALEELVPHPLVETSALSALPGDPA